MMVVFLFFKTSESSYGPPEVEILTAAPSAVSGSQVSDFLPLGVIQFSQYMFVYCIEKKVFVGSDLILFCFHGHFLGCPGASCDRYSETGFG